MLCQIIILAVFQFSVNAILHIDHVIVDNNKKYNNLTINYWHDDAGNAKVNMTLKSFFVCTKILVYIKLNIAEDIHDDLFKKELVRTQIDFNKLYDGIYGNLLIKGFMESLIQDIKQQNFSIPLKPVRNFH